MRRFGLAPLVILFLLNAVDELDRTAFALLLPEIRDHFHLSTAGAGVLAAAVIPAGLLFAIPVAYLADRSRRVTIAVAGAAAWAGFSVATGIAPTVMLLGVARVGAGLGRAVNDPVHGSLLSDYYPPEVRGRVFGTHRAANTVGAFFGPLAAGVVAEAFGWRAPFLLFAIPTGVLLLFALSLREPNRTGRGPTIGAPRFTEGIRILWRVRTLRRIWLAIPFLSIVAIGFSFLLSLYYRDVFGLDVAVRGRIAAFDAPFILIGLLVGAPLIDRSLARDPGRVMRTIGMAAFAVAPLLVGMAVAPTMWWAIAFHYTIVALGIVLLAGGTALVSLVAPPHVRAGAFAFYGVFALAGVALLPVVALIGDIYDLRLGIAAIAPIVAVGAWILAGAGRHAAADVATVSELGAGASHTRPT